jgi:HAE1 family hydrophobic/amphiphilic exporter-1
MSLARTAIHRPITMYMICAVIVLLGGISLTRLPVDLMPDVTYPSITIRVSYPGVGPLEMEELVARPIEQAVAAVAGVVRRAPDRKARAATTPTAKLTAKSRAMAA